MVARSEQRVDLEKKSGKNKRKGKEGKEETINPTPPSKANSGITNKNINYLTTLGVCIFLFIFLFPSLLALSVLFSLFLQFLMCCFFCCALHKC